MKPAFSLCVYCGSRTGNTDAFAQTAKAVGQWIGQHQGQLVYGGGNSGLMGIVAAATQQAGGRVVGIIPSALAEKEHARDDCDEFYLVDNMLQPVFEPYRTCLYMYLSCIHDNFRSQSCWECNSRILRVLATCDQDRQDEKG